MAAFRSLDWQVHHQLQKWPNLPPGLPEVRDGRGHWLRGRPAAFASSCPPYLKLPGSDRMRTLPDGLWLHFGGRASDPYVDVFAIEACGTLQNLLDKRSRFAAGTHSLVAVCPVQWMLAPAASGESVPRWHAMGLAAQPQATFYLPVRDRRVMYGLKAHHYAGFASSQIPHAHEFFVTIDALTAEDALENPKMRAMVARAAVSANFMHQ